MWPNRRPGRARAQATATSGLASFQNIPFRTLLVEGEDAAGRIDTVASVGGNRTLRLVLKDFEPASPIDNNDFSLGLDGWDVGDAPVELIPHAETLQTATPESSQPEGTARAAIEAVSEDIDLRLNTSGEGPQSISRTFQIAESTRAVKVRYRFITTEVPGGYFGTQYNDYFSVSIRSQGEGGNATESNSMNGLGSTWTAISRATTT